MTSRPSWISRSTRHSPARNTKCAKSQGVWKYKQVSEKSSIKKGASSGGLVQRRQVLPEMEMSFNNQQMGETGSTLYHKLVWGILIIMAKASAEILRLHRWTAIVYKASSQAPHVAFCDPNLALVFFFPAVYRISTPAPTAPPYLYWPLDRHLSRLESPERPYPSIS